MNTIGEVIIGWIGDQTWVSSHILYAICMILCAVSTALMPLVESYPILLGIHNTLICQKEIVNIRISIQERTRRALGARIVGLYKMILYDVEKKEK